MKNRFAAMILFFTLCIPLCCVPAHGEDLWSEDYYHASDTTGELSEAQRDSLDEDCIEFMKQYHYDLALLCLTAKNYEDSTLGEKAEAYYESCGFGYGEGRDGFLWVYDADADQVTLFSFGAAEGIVTQDYEAFITDAALSLKEEHGIFGILYSGIRYLSNYLDNSAKTVEDGTGVERGGEGSALPAWYPADTENFPFYHDEDAPRVIDDADIFSDVEEQVLEARITEIRAELRRDIVIYTDVTDYGLGKDICAADFYDFNGYGYGSEREGVCLYIDMDPNDRGWWCCCTGSETMGLYSADIANSVDDVLYEYMSSGRYSPGVANWIENIRMLYIKGNPFVPEWYPAAGETLTPRHDPDAPRVVDELGLLTEAEIAELTARATEIAQRHGVDVAIHTMISPVGMSYNEVGGNYYTYMGYGFGENYDGIILNVFKREGYYATPRIAAFGSVTDKLSELNEDRMWDACSDRMEKFEYHRAMSYWLDQTDHMLRTGRVQRSTLYWVLIGLAGLLAGSVFGGISLGMARAKMNKPAEQRDADAYIDPGSRITDAGSYYLYTTTSRRYDPPRERSSHSSSGGSSSSGSYSGSYSGSSGSSHSGSGRSF